MSVCTLWSAEFDYLDEKLKFCNDEFWLSRGGSIILKGGLKFSRNGGGGIFEGVHFYLARGWILMSRTISRAVITHGPYQTPLHRLLNYTSHCRPVVKHN